MAERSFSSSWRIYNRTVVHNATALLSPPYAAAGHMMMWLHGGSPSECIAVPPVEVLAHVLLAAADETALFIANAPDQGAARDQGVTALNALLDGLRAK